MAVVSAHCVHIWLVARDARDRAVGLVRNDPSHPPSDAIVAIILSAAAMEAFINELAEFVDAHRVRLDEFISPEMHAFADAIREIEDKHGSLQEKYVEAAKTLCGSPFNRGADPFQDFNVLVKLRNDLMHPKPQETPKYIADLQQRGLAHTLGPDVGISWFDTLTTEPMATWAVKTAHDMILAVLDLIPDDPFGPAQMFKSGFRNRTP